MLGQTNQDVKIQWQVSVRHVVLLKMSHTFSYIVQEPSKRIQAHLNYGPPSSNGGKNEQGNTYTPPIELYYWGSYLQRGMGPPLAILMLSRPFYF